jgi:ornithine carbamoyltransferase
MMKKDLLSLYDLEPRDFQAIFEKTAKLKKMLREGVPYTPLAGKTLGMIFDKSSTRTRLSFEVGIYQLGGIAVYLNSRDIQLARGESVEDTARVVSRYLDGLMIRTFSQSVVESFARFAEIPVINGLTDLLHPCQILGDLFTVSEKKVSHEGLRVAYVGDGNNIANTWVEAAARLPMTLALACPAGYDPDAGILERAMKDAAGRIQLFREPQEAVSGADVVYTDVWASMGQEAQKEARAKAFRNYQVNSALMARAKADAIVMHCLPAHRGEEITAEVMDGPQSVIVDQAENRLHVQKAIMEMLMGGGKRG